MKPLPLYQVDAFADALFRGNPAAVVPLAAWLPDETLQAIADENNLSETAYCVPAHASGRYHLRWFTPRAEVGLCGHATLAAAWVLFHHREPDRDVLTFDSRSGPLQVRREPDGALTLDFPAEFPEPAEAPQALIDGLGRSPEACCAGMDWLCVWPDEAAVRAIDPDFRELASLDRRGVIVTAPGDGCAFVSRYFAPAYGIDEDPVTGSIHCALTPYWADRLGRTELAARQLSRRGGSLRCRLDGDRVHITGRVVPYLEGRITLEG
jgi:PhzF family phenazine biosynthesis protein